MTQEPQSPTQVIAASVRRLRTDYGWSAQRLADEMTAAGVKWDRMIVVNLEHGRRGTVDVAELLVLGRVFDVPPLSLLAPIGQNVTIDAVPGQAMEPYETWQWVAGEERPQWLSPGAEGWPRWLSVVQAHSIFTAWTDAEGRLRVAHRNVRKADMIGEQAGIQEARKEYFRALERWAQVLTAMHANGLQPPEFPAVWEEEAREYDLIGET